MRKGLIVLLVLSYIMLSLTGCTGKGTAPAEKAGNSQSGVNTREVAEEPGEEGIVEIREKMFITQINDIYLNPEDYMDKKIKLEGFHSIIEADGETIHGVIRNGPGCCGNDGVAGFEFVWDGEYPEKNAWLRVVGTLQLKEEDGTQYMYLKASEVQVLEQRGASFVAN